MQLSINGKQLDIGAALREHIEAQLPGVVGKYFENPTDAHVTVSKEGPAMRVDVTVHVGKGMEWEGRSEEMDIHVSFNAALEHIEKQLRRYKRMKRDNHREQQSGGEAGGFVDEG